MLKMMQQSQNCLVFKMRQWLALVSLVLHLQQMHQFQLGQYAKIACLREEPETAESLVESLEHIFVKKDYQTATAVCMQA